MALTQAQFEALEKEGFSLDEIISFEKQRGASERPVNKSGKTSSPEDFLQQELANTKPAPLRPGMSFKDYMFEAQPAFKLALEHPETLTGQAISPTDIEKTTGSTYADIYRRAGLPGSQSTNMAGQLIPEIAGTLLDVGTRPSAAILPNINRLPGANSGMAQAFKQFMSQQRRPGQGISRVLDVKKGAAFAEGVRKEFIQVKTNAVQQFGQTLDDLAAKFPNKKISVQGIIDDIDTSKQEISKEAMNVFRKTPFLRDAIEGRQKEFTVKEVQEAVNYLNTKVPKNIRANNLDILDVIGDLKGAQLEAFPEEMQAARSAYAKVIEPYNNVKSQFRFNRVLKAIENNFGGAEGRKAVEGLLPKRIIREIGGYQKAYETLKHMRQLAPWLGVAAAGTTGGYVAGRAAQALTNPP